MAVTISGSTGIDKVVDGSIATVDLANDAVTTDKLNLNLHLIQQEHLIH